MSLVLFSKKWMSLCFALLSFHLKSIKILQLSSTIRWRRTSSFVRHLSTATSNPSIFQTGSMSLEKPLIDERLFHQLYLKNGIAVTLISDQRSEKSSCALSIGYGAARDTLPGLAHMTEHAVFLGSEKYPEENAYKKYLNKNGGGSNGATGMEYTSYKFYVNADAFEGALDIFSQFFKKPLLSHDSIKREVHAVDSEDSKNRILDNRRTLQILKDVMKANISYSKYSTGNLYTLSFGSTEENGDILVESVKEFHRMHYLPHKMNLCLVGPQSLSELERLATVLFADISTSKDINSMDAIQTSEDVAALFDNGPFESVYNISDDNNLILKIRPSKDIRDISFLWTLPYDRKLYRSDSISLINYLLNQRESGTLLATLQDLGLATAVSGSYRTTFMDPNTNKSFAVYDIGVSLTEEGLKSWRIVQEYVMSTIKLIAGLSTQQIQMYWEEIQAISSLSFAFQSQPSAYEQANSAVSNMLDYKLEHVLSGDSLVGDFDSARFHDYCSRILTQSQVILIRSRAFSSIPESDDKEYIKELMKMLEENTVNKEDVATWKKNGSYFHRMRDFINLQRENGDKPELSSEKLWKEPFYGVPYIVEFEPRQPQQTDGLNDLQPIHLPHPNRFICRRLLQQVENNPQFFRDRLSQRKIYSTPPTNVHSSLSLTRYDQEQERSYPLVSENKTLWISTDEVFFTPKSVFHLFIPKLIPENAECTVHPRNSLFNTFFDQIASREFFDAYAAGLSTDLSWSRRGLIIKFRGYTEGVFEFTKLLLYSILGITCQANGEYATNDMGLWRTKITPVLFENFKEKHLRGLRSWKQNRPDSQAESILSYALGEGNELPERLIPALEATSMDDLFHLEDEVKSMIRQYLRDYSANSNFKQNLLSGKGNGMAHLHGSLMKEDGATSLTEMFASVANKLENVPETEEKQQHQQQSLSEVMDRTRVLPKGTHTVISLSAFNEQDNNHAYVLFIQTDLRSPRNSALMLLVRRLWAEPAFNTLRTQQQLGYIVSFTTEGFGRGRYGMRGFELRVLSKRFNPSEIESSVEKFLLHQILQLESGEITDQDIKDIAASIVKTLKDPPTSYGEEANEFWSSIANEFPFDWQDRVIEQLNTLTKDDVQAFVREYISHACDRKSVAVHIYGATTDSENQRLEYTRRQTLSLEDNNQNEIKSKLFLGSNVSIITDIDDIDTWRRTLAWSERATSF